MVPSLSVSSEPSRPPVGPAGRTRSLTDSAGPGEPVTPAPPPLLVQRDVPGPCFSCLALWCWPREPSDGSAGPEDSSPAPRPGGIPPQLRGPGIKRCRCPPLETGANPGSPQMVCGRQSPADGSQPSVRLLWSAGDLQMAGRPPRGGDTRSGQTSACRYPATPSGRRSAAIPRQQPPRKAETGETSRVGRLPAQARALLASPLSWDRAPRLPPRKRMEMLICLPGGGSRGLRRGEPAAPRGRGTASRGKRGPPPACPAPRRTAKAEQPQLAPRAGPLPYKLLKVHVSHPFRAAWRPCAPPSVTTGRSSESDRLETAASPEPPADPPHCDSGSCEEERGRQGGVMFCI